MSQPAAQAQAQPQNAVEQLWGMIQEGQLAEAKTFLQSPGGSAININWGHPGFSKWTPLHNASSNGMADFVRIILRHPNVQVNAMDAEGKTAFFHAAHNNQLSSLLELLQDARVDVNRPDANGATPLWWAAFKGDLEVIRLMIASGRPVDLNAKTTRSPVPRAELTKLTPIDAARKAGHGEAVSLLERFKAAPEKTRQALRQQPGTPTFMVTTPARLTPEGYVVYLQGKEVPQSLYVQPPVTPPISSGSKSSGFFDFFK